MHGNPSPTEPKGTLTLTPPPSINPSPVTTASVRAAQFALAPHSVTTTVVTTTTTKITEFPPLLLGSSSSSSSLPTIPSLKNLRSLNVAEFPLANTPTPPALKKFCFDLNGVPTRLTELDLYEKDMVKLNSSKPKPDSVLSRSDALHHLQHHTNSLPSVHLAPLGTNQIQTSPIKNTRKRDHRGAAFVNPQATEHETDGLHSSVPPTPFPDPSIPLVTTGMLPPIVTTATTTIVAGNSVDSPSSVIHNTLEQILDEQPPNLPSPTMSPTLTTPPLNAFFIPTVSAPPAGPSTRNAGATSPVSRTSNTRRDHTNNLSLTPSPTSRHHQIPPHLTSIPQIISTFDNLPTPLQSYLLLHLLRRCPSKTLQFVSTLILPALKQDFLGDLPAELAYQILGHLDVRTLGRVAVVCKRWKDVVDGPGAAVAVWKGRLVSEGWWSDHDVRGVLERWVMWRRAKKIGKDNAAKKDVAEKAVETSASARVLMKKSGESLNSCSTFVGGDDVGSSSGVGLGVFPASRGSLRTIVDDIDEDEEKEDDEKEDGMSDVSYEFEEDEEEDFFDAEVGPDGNVMEDDGGDEFLELFVAAHSDASLTLDTARWIQALDEFATGIASTDSTSMYGNAQNSAFRRDGGGSLRRGLRISRVRSRLRKFIEGRTKSELNQLALQIPNLYKSMYRRHHIIRRNWSRGSFQTIDFPGHGSHVVTCLQFDSDKIVSGSDDQSIHIYDTKTGRIRRKLNGHDGGVWALQYWGDALVSGSTDRSVRVWDMDTGHCTHLFEGHTSTVRCLMIIPPSPATVNPFGPNTGAAATVMEPSVPLVVTGSRDATLRVWRLPNPKTDKFHVPPNGLGVVHTHEDDPNNTYDKEPNPYFMHVLTGHTNSVRAIAGHGRVLVSGSYDCTVRVWDLITGESIHTFRGHREKVYSVGYSHELARAVSGSLDASVKVWCTRTGVLLHNLEGHTSLVGLLELSPEYLVSAAADQSLRIWEPKSGACLAHLHGHPAAITCFHHDARLNRVVSGSDGGVKLWELSSANGGGGSGVGVGPGFEFRQGPNGPEPVYGRFTRDLVSGVAGVWRVRMDERRLVAAISKEGGSTYFQVLDFGENVEHGAVISAPGDGGEWMGEDDEDDEEDDEDDDGHGDDEGSDGEDHEDDDEGADDDGGDDDPMPPYGSNESLPPLAPPGGPVLPPLPDFFTANHQNNQQHSMSVGIDGNELRNQLTRHLQNTAGTRSQILTSAFQEVHGGSSSSSSSTSLLNRRRGADVSINISVGGSSSSSATHHLEAPSRIVTRSRANAFAQNVAPETVPVADAPEM